ncbi:MAG TPA: hypothetical protein VM142_03565 [Acidimicrobiales bacterium]|nr:hypothetical protein [Acidimicrobiales bacterium]
MQVQRSSHRRVGAVVGALVLVVVVGAATAWACSAQAWVSGRPDYGPAGSKATITGSGFYNGTVSVYWEDWNGTVLATPQGPSFVVDVIIPANAVNDVHVIHARGNGTSASMTFEVVPEGGQRSATTPTERSANEASTGGRSTSGVPAATGEPESSSTPTPAGSPATAGSGAVGFPSAQSSAEAQPTGEATTPAAPAVSSSGAATAASAGTAGTSAGPAKSGSTAATGTQSPDVPAGAGAVPADPEASAESRPVASRAASGDLWSGFAPGLPSERGASLSGALPTPSSGSSPLTAGVMLLALGVVALGAGFGLAERGRARVVAQTR